jgi:hypothetical protein
MFFVAERAIREASLEAYGLPRLPPEVRIAEANGDRGRAACQPQAMELLTTLAIAAGFGPGGRRFKSCLPDPRKPC